MFILVSGIIALPVIFCEVLSWDSDLPVCDNVHLVDIINMSNAMDI